MSLFEVDDTLSVKQLSARFAKMLRREFSAEVWVRGQIRNLSRPPSGHVYFDLVEPVADGEAVDALIKVVMFRTTKEQINRMLTRSAVGTRFEDGMEIRIRAAVDWYPPSGSLQLKMSTIDPEYTLGRLAADRQQLLARLKAEGLLHANHQWPVPLVPLNVALVTSARSAAAADFDKTLNSSPYAFSIRLLDSRMQGITAAESIARAIHLAAVPDGDPTNHPDVVCVIRGGGAKTDLAVFDAEIVARAIANCPVPVLCGVGHEIDRSVADEVAAMSHKTPTACAQELVDRVAIADAHFFVATERLAAAAHRLPHNDLARLEALVDRLATAPGTMLAEADGRVQRCAARLQHRSSSPLAGSMVRLENARSRLINATEATLATARDRSRLAVDQLDRTSLNAIRQQTTLLQTRQDTLRLLDPVNLLQRGWSITTSASGATVRSVQDVDPDDLLTTRLADGKISSRVLTQTDDNT